MPGTSHMDPSIRR